MRWRRGKREMRVARREAGSRPMRPLDGQGTSVSFGSVTCS